MSGPMKKDDCCHAPSRFGPSTVSIMQHWLLHLVGLNPAAPIHTTVVVALIGRLRRRELHAARWMIWCIGINIAHRISAR